jgi:hypothetical protein
MSTAADAPNGVSAASASSTSVRKRALAPSGPSSPTIVALPASASLPVCLPTSAGSPSTSRRSSAIWNALPTAYLAIESLALRRARSPEWRRRGRRTAAPRFHRLQRRDLGYAKLLRHAAIKRPSAARSASTADHAAGPAHALAPAQSTRTARFGCVSGRQDIERKVRRPSPASIAVARRGLLCGGLATPRVACHRRRVVVSSE